ncbi:MAG: 4Fe-4S cluster-binding domain-containing protein, partial [Firmicutes bacterium]|nr:4Fe-4S cluster-binding domain-containing protein [Bacillota bacterium]
MQLRIAGIIPNSLIDGPGIRLVLFLQGCLLRCRGCHNPLVQDLNGGELISLDKIWTKIDKTRGISGATF